MGKISGSVAWSLAWTVAAGLALLLFAIMSLFVLRTTGMPAPAGSATPAPVLTPDINAAGAEDATPQPPVAAAPVSGAQSDPVAMIGLWLSAVSAITALVGLVSSLWLGWHKERREVAQHLLELERTYLEVEKLRRELDRNIAGDSGEASVTQPRR
jgi:hypothetical protein